MSSPTLIRRFALGAGVLAMPLGAPPASAPPAPGDNSVVVESRGDGSTALVLPPRAEVGQTASSTASIDITIEAEGQTVDVAIEFRITSTVTGVAADGEYTVVVTIDEIALTEAPAAADPSTLGYGELTGLQLEQRFDRAGRILATELLDADELSDQMRATAEGFASNLRTAQFAYPSEPVGIGAVWTTELDIASQGFAIPAAYRFEVTDITDGRYTLTIAYRSEFETSADGVDATGTVSGLGIASGSVENPLDISVDLGQTIQASAAGEDLSVSISVASHPAAG